MSKPVRIRGDVVARVQVVADGERRSLANMVEVLLLQALERAEVPSARAGAKLVVEGAVLTERGGLPPSGGSVAKSSGARESSSPRSVSAVPSRNGKCTMDTAAGSKCKFCGEVHK